MDIKKAFSDLKDKIKNGILKKNRIVVYLRARKGLNRKEKYFEKKANQKTYKYIAGRGLLKQNSRKFLIGATAALLAITMVLAYPDIKQALIEKKINSMPVEIHAPVETLTDPELDNKGKVIENQDTPEELVEAYEFLNEKLLGDADIFDMDIDTINKIDGIYQIDLANSNFSKDFVIQLLVNANDKDYIFEYTALGEDFGNGFDIDTSVNSTSTILSLVSNLSNCYPSNIIEQDEQKVELAQKIKEIYNKDVIVGDPIIYAENAVSNEYQIPVYQKDSCTLYTIKESIIADNSEDINFEAVFNLLIDYLDGKNDFFEVKDIKEIDTANTLYSAFNAATQYDYEISF